MSESKENKDLGETERPLMRKRSPILAELKQVRKTVSNLGYYCFRIIYLGTSSAKSIFGIIMTRLNVALRRPFTPVRRSVACWGAIQRRCLQLYRAGRDVEGAEVSFFEVSRDVIDTESNNGSRFASCFMSGSLEGSRW